MNRIPRPHRIASFQAGVLAFVFALLVAHDARSDAVSITDDRGVKHTFAQPPQRVVTLLPSLTEAVCVVGACGRLVGTDRYSNWPVAVAALPLRVLSFESNRHDQVRSTLQRLGQLFAAGPAAETAWRAIEADIERAATQVPSRLKGRSVYFEADSTPYAAGEASFLGQTLQRLHLRNVAPAALGAFPKLSPEFIVRAQPDVILATRRHVQEMPGRPGWSTLKALRERQVCGFDEPTYELLIRPGPRMGEAALAMARCLAALPATP
jgi:iron complex transport system substrate-binding protein